MFSIFLSPTNTFFSFFSFSLPDRPRYYKKRKFNDLEEEFIPTPSATSDDPRAGFHENRRTNEAKVLTDEFGAGPSRQSNEPSATVRFVNLASNEALVRRRSVPPIKVYTGNSIYLEVKEFRKQLYVGFFKEEAGLIKNRFNFPMTHLDKVEEGFRVIKEHVENSGV